MAEPAVTAARALPPELDDIQGIVRHGYREHREACFLLLRVKDAPAACAWLRQCPVASAAPLAQPPPTMLQVALTSQGMRALGVDAAVVDAFAQEFVDGMAGDAHRARRLGDVGDSDPQRWQWGAGSALPHVLLLLYARPGCLAAWQQRIEAELAAGFEMLRRLNTTDMGGIEPFGFADGISQPALDWDRQRAPGDHQQLAYATLSCLGEVLLGYPSEYGLYTPRPLLAPGGGAAQALPWAEDEPAMKDLGRNGSYLVLRQLQQDVHGFWQTLDRCANGNASERQRLAEAMVGRTRSGQPLVAPDAPDQNAFDYAADPRGVRCPLGAHIRRSNPRNADLPGGAAQGRLGWLLRTLGLDAPARAQDLVASTRFHRLLRRGREYGVPVPQAAALSGPPAAGSETGLHFICLGANIARQFEFVQSAWLMGTHFDGLRNESDPLLGDRAAGRGHIAADAFSMPQDAGPDQRIAGLPRFVTVRGGAYFFLPGIRALRFLASAPQ